MVNYEGRHCKIQHKRSSHKKITLRTVLLGLPYYATIGSLVLVIASSSRCMIHSYATPTETTYDESTAVSVVEESAAPIETLEYKFPAISIVDEPVLEEQVSESVMNDTEEVIETEPEVVEDTNAVQYVYNLSDNDKAILVRIAKAEAGNQGIDGEALVMQVILNRAFGDNEFPDTIEGVVFQKHQFSPIDDGAYYNVDITDELYTALDRVLQGTYKDWASGALYFTSQTESNTWHSRNLKYLFKYKDHKFYK